VRRIDTIGIVISATITLFSLGLLLISLKSYSRYKNKKLVFICVVFLVLLLKGVLFSISMLFQEFSWVKTYVFSVYSGLFDVFILLLLFMGTLMREKL
jgi:O-antigen/teichoic acid export membrane protein